MKLLKFSKYSIYFRKILTHTTRFSLDYCHQKDKKYNRIETKRVPDQPVSADHSCPSSATLVSNRDAKAEIRKHRTKYAKEEDIKTMMDMMLIADSDNVSELLLLTIM